MPTSATKKNTGSIIVCLTNGFSFEKKGTYSMAKDKITIADAGYIKS